LKREDIWILELNILRLDRDQVRNELANKMRARVSMERQLRLLTGFQDEGTVMAAGNLPDRLAQKNGTSRRVLANRSDLKAAKLAIEVRDAELGLAQPPPDPNSSLGPRYKRDNNENLFGGEMTLGTERDVSTRPLSGHRPRLE
jgi:outer membrane protein TolC